MNLPILKVKIMVIKNMASQFFQLTLKSYFITYKVLCVHTPFIPSLM